MNELTENIFQAGNILKSQCGDTAIVLKTGLRTDIGDIKKKGVYAYWIKEQIAFWMDMDEPQISLQAEERENGDRKDD